MKIVIGSDHAGFALKEAVVESLRADGLTVIDVGTHDGETSVDYPDFAFAVANQVASQPQLGVLVCGTGIGMSIAANRVPGVRAALVHDRYTAQMAREHNNANVLVLGGRLLTESQGVELVQTWLGGSFVERHQRRLDLIEAHTKSMT